MKTGKKKRKVRHPDVVPRRIQQPKPAEKPIPVELPIPVKVGAA